MNAFSRLMRDSSSCGVGEIIYRRTHSERELFRWIELERVGSRFSMKHFALHVLTLMSTRSSSHMITTFESLDSNTYNQIAFASTAPMSQSLKRPRAETTSLSLPSTRVRLVEDAAAHLYIPFHKISVFHRIKFISEDPYADSSTHVVVDSIHCEPSSQHGSFYVPGRFDTALVNIKDGCQAGVKGTLL